MKSATYCLICLYRNNLEDSKFSKNILFVEIKEIMEKNYTNGFDKLILKLL